MIAISPPIHSLLVSPTEKGTFSSCSNTVVKLKHMGLMACGKKDIDIVIVTFTILLVWNFRIKNEQIYLISKIVRNFNRVQALTAN